MTNKVETRQCKRCSSDYMPSYYEVLGIRILQGAGYCPNCALAVYKEEQVKEETIRLAEIAKIRRQRRENSGIPVKYMNEDFSTFEKGWQDDAYKICLDYALNFPINRNPQSYPSLYLYSIHTWGTGKTHLSCAIIHRILDRWKGDTDHSCPRPVFVSESDLFRRIQATYSFNHDEQKVRESEDDIIKSLVYADLLVLDDVAKEKRADPRFVQRTLFNVINERYNRNLPMVISANVGPTGLKSHLESASFDRLWEMCKGKAIRMDGKSYRLEAKSKDTINPTGQSKGER